METINDNNLTPLALARALGVNVSTVARWKKQGCPHEEKAPYALRANASRPRYNLKAVLNWIKEKQASYEENRSRA